MIHVTTSGSTKNLETALRRVQRGDIYAALERFGPVGVAALRTATPEESGATADSWYYEIVRRRGYFAIHWYNSHKEDGIPIAAIIQFGHGTRNGGWVEGIDFINPAMRPLFRQIAEAMWKEVTR